MDVGKLPNDLLASLLKRVEGRDPRVIIGPGIGRDAAVIDTGGPKLLVAKSDPITFASDLIGWYAVHVNANDVACTGRHARRGSWRRSSFPKSADALLAESVFDQIGRGLRFAWASSSWAATPRLLSASTRPIVAGAMLGEVERDRLVRPDGARPGDALILTKGIAIEGTAFSPRRRARGCSGSAVARGQSRRRNGTSSTPESAS